MKKELLKKSICGIALGCVLALGTGLVNAELNNETKVIKVGSADAPVYSYEINMGTMGFFDWFYNNETQSFEWRNSCLAVDASTNKTLVDNSEISSNIIAMADKFFDSNCQMLNTSTPTSGIYHIELDNKLLITDTSTYGKIKASVEYVPNENYKWTGMNITTSYYSCEEVHIDSSRPYNALSFYKDEACSNFYTDNSTFNVYNNRTYTYKVRSAQIENLTTVYEEYPTSYSKSLKFDDPKLYYFSDTNGISPSYRELENRVAEATFAPFIVQLNDDDKETFSSPLAGDTMGTITIKIQEDI